MMHYPYSVLSPSQTSIRLLRLLPGRGKDEIRCQLFDYELNNGSRSGLYEALSYVWGDATISKNIRISSGDREDPTDTYLNVTDNLFTALCRLRDPSLDRVLWIDALCINQQDLEERANQVQLMTAIYSHASRVIVWLGDEADGSSVACQMIRDAADADQRKLFLDPLSHSSDDRSYAGYNKASFRMLLHRPWFRRIWVLQEVAAARFTLILCGSEELTGSAFCRGIVSLNALLEGDEALFPIIQSSLLLIQWERTNTSNQDFRISRLTLGVRPLYDLVNMFNDFEATDPRDKIYALLGMSTELSDDSEFSPDYRKPFSVLLEQYVRSIVGRDTEIRICSEPQAALTIAKGCALGHVMKVRSEGRNQESFGKQLVKIGSDHIISKDGFKTRWSAVLTLPSSAKPIRKGDIVCLIREVQKPLIVRPDLDHFSIIMPVVEPPLEVWTERFDTINWATFTERIPSFQRIFPLLWSWEPSKSPAHTPQAPQDHMFAERNSLFRKDELERMSHMARIMEDLRDQKRVGNIIARAQSLVQQSDSAISTSHMVELSKCYGFWDIYMVLKDDFVTKISSLPDIPFVSASKKWDILDIKAFTAKSPSSVKTYRDWAIRQCVELNDPQRLHVLLEIFSVDAPIEQVVVRRVVECPDCGSEMLLDLLQHLPKLPITEMVVEAAARRPDTNRFNLLLEHCRGRLPISAEMIAILLQHTNYMDARSKLSLVMQSDYHDVEGVYQILHKVHACTVPQGQWPDVRPATSRETLWQNFFLPNADQIAHLVEHKEFYEHVESKGLPEISNFLYESYAIPGPQKIPWAKKSWGKIQGTSSWRKADTDARKQMLLQVITPWRATSELVGPTTRKTV